MVHGLVVGQQWAWCSLSPLPAWAGLWCCWCKRAELKDCDSGVRMLSHSVSPGLSRAEAKQEYTFLWICFLPSSCVCVQLVGAVLQFCLDQSGIQPWTWLQEMIVKFFLGISSLNAPRWLHLFVCIICLPRRHLFMNLFSLSHGRRKGWGCHSFGVSLESFGM